MNKIKLFTLLSFCLIACSNKRGSIREINELCSCLNIPVRGWTVLRKYKINTHSMKYMVNTVADTTYKLHYYYSPKEEKKESQYDVRFYEKEYPINDSQNMVMGFELCDTLYVFRYNKFFEKTDLSSKHYFMKGQEEFIKIYHIK